MVKSETRRDAEILVRNPSLRLFGKKFRDSKKVKTNHAKTRLRDFRDFEILPKFSKTHVFRGTIRHPLFSVCILFILSGSPNEASYIISAVHVNSNLEIRNSLVARNSH